VTSTLAPLDPAKTTTVTTLRVRFAETDLMGIAHHASYLVYFEAARVEWLRRRGVTYADWAHKGIHVAVVEVNVRYKAPARFDDLLAIETALAELRAVSMRFVYVIRRGDTIVAEGMTRLGCIDDEQKLVHITDAMREVLVAGEQTGTPTASP
jgi:acyl-CoA thioester hydrolase